MRAYAVGTSWPRPRAWGIVIPMTMNRSITPRSQDRPGAATADRSKRRFDRGLRPVRHDASNAPAVGPDRGPGAGDPVGHEQASRPAPAFRSVLCAVDRSPNSNAARRQAAQLVRPGGSVRVVRLPELTSRGRDGLREACEHRDLLVLGAGRAAMAAVEHAPIPVLVARSCPLGVKVTDTILVPVDGSPESARAVELAGALADAHGGTVSLLPAPMVDSALERAVAASSRVLLHATGAAPRVVNQPLPPEHAIPAARVDLAASLIVLGLGPDQQARSTTARMIGSVGCSVLTIRA